MVRVFLYGDVAQLAEQFLHTEKVVGSDPTFTTNFRSLVKLNIISVYEIEVGGLNPSGSAKFSPR